MLSHAAPNPPVEPLGVVSLTNATVYTIHPSPNPHRMHYGVLGEDGMLLESTVDDRHHGEHTFIPPDPARFQASDWISRDAIYAGPLYHIYGHFIIESCQRLWWAATHPDLPIVWTADDHTAPELNSWERDILQILGIRNEVIVLTRPTRFDRLHVPDAGYKYADWSHPQHIDFLAAYNGPPQEPGTKLWLSRDPAHGRGVVNRHIVERKLRDLDWTIVTFELMPVRAQLDALAKAEVIAGEEASTFHNLLLLKDIRGKQFHVFRRHGPEHLSFATIGTARAVDQRFYSCSKDALVSARGRAVVRLAPNPAQYLSHLGIPIAERRSLLADDKPGCTVRRLNRLADITGAETYLQLGWLGDAAFAQLEVARRDIVDEEFGFDVRGYRDQVTHFYEVSLKDFLSWFAKGRTYDLVMLADQHDWQDALDNVRTIFTVAAHDRTLLVLDNVNDVQQTVLALHDHNLELDFRTIGTNRDFQAIIWQRRRAARPRFEGEEEIAALTYADIRKHRNLFATVTEDKAMAEVRNWLFPDQTGRLSRLVRRASAGLRKAVAVSKTEAPTSGIRQSAQQLAPSSERRAVGRRTRHTGSVTADPSRVCRPDVLNPGSAVASQMPYLEFLSRLHTALRPATYLEIGVYLGQSLAMARARAIGIDPNYSITAPISCDVSLFRTTSDDYFARPEPLAPFSGTPVDLAFIDGMHLLEFAFRDFINVERVSRPSGVIVFDDVFPRTVAEAQREQQARSWTGDVYKIVEVLRQYRPDLTLTLVDTFPTGLLLVTGLDPGSRVLNDRYDAIVEQYVTDDPQEVSAAILGREGAIAPETLLSSPVWAALRRSRRPWVSAHRARAEMTEALLHPDGYRIRRRELRRAASRTLTRVASKVRAVRSH